MTKKQWREPRRQVAALPFRFDMDGELQVLLVTSRETRRWVIPKGWPMPGRKEHKAAEREAFEEAGLKGRINKTALGTYEYEKRLKSGMTVTCEVKVFPLHVIEQCNRWPEQGQRDLRWIAPDEAADLVQEDGLKLLLHAFVSGEFDEPGGNASDLSLPRRVRTASVAHDPAPLVGETL
ncbi:NUDIX hydrolase [Methylobacterium nodulans]|uniref:NUDIX hydrolase n=1 Tax=Methylobacterium nodulans (strain LMG 21967 / CNCM I-2342 / ORS 2060) TaxID=460265 RepID=B8IY26_METNO|nr:NUDIX hydrolase [Methylobacterium nodulans ORS 2060]